jgi:hypothetical protein
MPILPPAYHRLLRERDPLLRELRRLRRLLAQERDDSAPLAHELARSRRETTAIARALRTWLSRRTWRPEALRPLLARLERLAQD